MKSIKLRKTPDKKPDKPIDSASSNTKRRLNRRGILLVGMGLILVIPVVGFALYKNGLFVSEKDEVVCGVDIQNEVAKYLMPLEKDKLKEQVDKIKQFDKYETDVACMYPVAIYSVNTGNLSDSESNYNILAEVYDESQGFPPVYRYRSADIKDLSDDIDRLRERTEEVKNNTIYFD